MAGRPSRRDDVLVQSLEDVRVKVVTRMHIDDDHIGRPLARADRCHESISFEILEDVADAGQEDHQLRGRFLAAVEVLHGEWRDSRENAFECGIAANQAEEQRPSQPPEAIGEERFHAAADRCGACYEFQETRVPAVRERTKSLAVAYGTCGRLIWVLPKRCSRSRL